MDEETQEQMFDDLPITDEKKKKEKVNCLGEILRETLDEFGLKDADVIRGTGIKWSSYFGWVTEQVSCQLCDKNLLVLWQFLNRYKKMDLQYLVYGIGEAEEIEESDDKNNDGHTTTKQVEVMNWCPIASARPRCLKRFMEFAKGLCSVVFLYTIMWCIFQWGYMEGKETANKKGYQFSDTRQAFNTNGVVQ